MKKVRIDWEQVRREASHGYGDMETDKAQYVKDRVLDAIIEAMQEAERQRIAQVES